MRKEGDGSKDWHPLVFGSTTHLDVRIDLRPNHRMIVPAQDERPGHNRYVIQDHLAHLGGVAEVDVVALILARHPPYIIPIGHLLANQVGEHTDRLVRRVPPIVQLEDLAIVLRRPVANDHDRLIALRPARTQLGLFQ